MTDTGKSRTSNNRKESAKENYKTRGLVMRKKQTKWTDDMRLFVLENYYGVTTKDLTEKINSEFGVDYSCKAVASYKKRYGLRNGIDARFPKGHVPQNKGQKMPAHVYEKAKRTMFKKGQAPVNHRPVGSERVTVDGYVEIKTEEPNVWQLKHRVIWERENGPVPEQTVLIFLDGNPLNVSLENLKLITRSELLIMNRYDLFTEDANANESASNLARLIDQTNKVKKRKCGSEIKNGEVK